MIEPLPCPFCGSTNLRFEFSGSQGYIECNECGTEGPCDENAADPICDMDAAYAIWNRRAALSQPVPIAPTDEELLSAAAGAIDPYASCGIAIGEYEAETECAVEAYGSELIAFARAVLALWGNRS